MKNIKESNIGTTKARLHVLESVSSRDLGSLVSDNRACLEQRLLECGAILFRGFKVSTIEDFENFGKAVSPQRLEYTYRSTPRTLVGNKVFTATEYPPSQEIALHCENSYQLDWPMKIAFCCLIPPTGGGETPIADMRQITYEIGDELLDRFESRQVRYVRHYRPHIDLPWETVFQTTHRDEVAAYCRSHNIYHEWIDRNTLRTIQVSQGAAKHPSTGERIFFNQAHLFHVSNLPPDIATSLTNMFGSDKLPRNAYFGDGESISEKYLEKIRQSLSKASMHFKWQPGDVMLLDNMLMAHGRNSYVGGRSVVVSLFDPYSEAAS